MNPIINPNTINPINNGKLVFTSQQTIVSDAIELSEDGSWGLNLEVSHMMTLTQPGLFNCQSPDGFHQIPISTYMVPGTTIIFIDFVGMNTRAYQAWGMVINERLGKQGYDWLQIIGQAVGLDFLHMPGPRIVLKRGLGR